MAGLNHQVHGELEKSLYSWIGHINLEVKQTGESRCPERAILSDHSNQDEKSDLGQESDAHDGDH
jgi:hypothetical protein